MKKWRGLFALLAALFCVVADGNAAVRTWTGAVSGAWADGGNWGGTSPAPGDDLVFPAGASNKFTTNNFPASTSFNSITVNDASYTLGGNAVTLSGTSALTIDPASLGLVVYNLPTTLSNSGATIAFNGGAAQTVNFNANLVVAGGNVTFDVAGTSPLNLFGSIGQTAAANVQKTGAGMLILFASNTYTGITTVSAGYLRISNGNALGAADNTAATGTFVNGGTLQVDNINVGNERLVLNGQGQSGNGGLQAIQGAPNWAGDVVLDGAGIFLNLGSILTIAGRISGPGDLAFGGTLVLANPSNNYAGATIIGSATMAGNLYLVSNGVIPDGSAVTMLNQSTWNLNGYTEVVGSLAGSVGAKVNLNGGAFGSTLILGADNTSTTYNGTFQGIASAILGKEGTGTLTLTGGSTNFFGATTIINPGGINVAAGASLANSTIVLADHGVIKGSGTVGPIVTTVGESGEVSPGTGPGRLTAASLAMTQGNQLTIELNGPTAVTQYDQLAVNGNVSLNNATLSVALGYAPVAGQQFRIIDNLGANPVNGTFNGLPQGATLTLGPYQFQINYAGGDGNDVVLTVTQAPAVALTSVASRKMHNAAGTFDLLLAQTPSNPTIEPRTGGNHRIVFTFNKAVVSGNVTITEGTATPALPAFNGNEMIVDLSNVTDAQYVTVAVSNVTSSDGGTDGGGSVRVGFLQGDANGSRTVTLSDMLFVNAVLTQFVTQSNFIRDVNLTGTLSLSDLLFVNRFLTHALPAP